MTANSSPATKETSVALLAEALAPRLAHELSQRVPANANGAAPTAQLLTLDELVARAPACEATADLEALAL